MPHLARQRPLPYSIKGAEDSVATLGADDDGDGLGAVEQEGLVWEGGSGGAGEEGAVGEGVSGLGGEGENGRHDVVALEADLGNGGAPEVTDAGIGDEGGVGVGSEL